MGVRSKKESLSQKTWIHCFILLPRSLFMVLFRSALPYFVTGWQIVPLKIAAAGARALLAMTNLVGFSGKRGSFRNEKGFNNGRIHCVAILGQRTNFTAQPLPCLVPGCRLVPFKIAASLSLLAMTNLVGFAGKRNKFRNETFEKQCEATLRIKCPHKTINVCFQN